jgi:NAD(P)-dependent dehydrogenase (short-subunit alcohol dehydrogenase family)
MLAAVQSTEVAQEHEHHRSLCPFGAEAATRPGVVGQGEVAERSQIHVRHTTHVTVPPAPTGRASSDVVPGRADEAAGESRAANAGRRLAFVTGASRGIGKQIAIALAANGHDVVITARTVNEGDHIDERSGLALPGSLATTADACEHHGAAVMPLPMDLLDDASVDNACRLTLELWGPPDVIVNNAIYQGEGTASRFLDTPMDALEKTFHGNVLAQYRIIKRFVPAMIDNGGGAIVNVVSAAGMIDPPAPVGEGGWSLAYGTSKGALCRATGTLALELGPVGVRVFGLEPGLVYTERMLAVHGEEFRAAAGGTGTTPDVIGRLCAWLVSDPAAAHFVGKNVHAQPLAAKLEMI